MARVDPRGPREQREALHPGQYLLALVWFGRKTSNNTGNRYLSCKFEVVGGRAKGQSFFSVMGLDLSKSGTVSRWQSYADACGVEGAFELGEYDEGTEDEGDQNIRALFLGVPFGAEVTKDYSGGYTNNGLGRYVFPRNWRPEWAEWANEYRQAREARSTRRPEDDAGEPPSDAQPYDDGFGAGSDELPEAPPPALSYADEDDDIPF